MIRDSTENTMTAGGIISLLPAAFLRSNVLPVELLGDLDHDGVITKKDANLLKQHLEDPNAQPYDGLLIADINMDSYIDMDDYRDYFFRYNLI